MSQQPMLTNYVSEIDQFLQEFDKTHPDLSKAQQNELNKYRRIYQLRDSMQTTPQTANTLWNDF